MWRQVRVIRAKGQSYGNAARLRRYTRQSTCDYGLCNFQEASVQGYWWPKRQHPKGNRVSRKGDRAKAVRVVIAGRASALNEQLSADVKKLRQFLRLCFTNSTLPVKDLGSNSF